MGAGLSAGLFGIGGGVITVPFVLFLTQASFREAVAMSLLVAAFTTPLGLWAHHRAGHVRWNEGALVAIGGIAGIILALAIEPYLEDAVLVLIFTGFLVYSAQRLAYGINGLLNWRGKKALLITGFFAGVLAKLLGVGGGLLIVPALVFLGYGIHPAVATSLAVVFFNTLSSTLINFWTIPTQDWILWSFPLALGAGVGIFFGSLASIRAQQDQLRRGFAVFLAVIALGLLYRAAS